MTASPPQTDPPPADRLAADSGRAAAVTPIAAALSAFLLFTIELIIGKAVLPWFGGTSQVWTTCLVFFQIVLFLGYAYAALLERCRPEWQSRIHAALLVASAMCLPVLPGVQWKPASDARPWSALLELLVATCALPILALAATTPLLIRLTPRAAKNGGPRYRLFAWSNTGSLLALALYPAAVERWLGLRTQAWIWSGGYVVLAVLVMAAVWGRPVDRAVAAASNAEGEIAPRAVDRLLWPLLAAMPAALLVAVTRHMLSDVAPVPLLWCLPLSIYLVTFIAAFAGTRWYVRPLWLALLLVGAFLMSRRLGTGYVFQNYAALLAIDAVALTVACAVCHAELVLLRPGARHLSLFYVSMSAGGAAGGILASVIAPLLLDTPDADLQTVTVCVLCVVALVLWTRVALGRSRRSVIGALAWSAAAVTIGSGALRSEETGGAVVASVRTFYGTLRVMESVDDRTIDTMRELVNGHISHGKQFVDERRRREPLTYYGPASGIGLVLSALQHRSSLRVGVIGLGAGTIAAYARPGDQYRFYELDPAVVDIARRHFWYLSDTDASWSVAVGDGRLSLEREAPQQFDVLAVDAFASDAVPVHLLTREAFGEYFRHLTSDGAVAVHVTNRYLDLASVVATVAAARGYSTVLLSSTVSDLEQYPSDWVIVTRNRALLSSPGLSAGSPIERNVAALWTDDYSSLTRQLK